MKKTWIGIISVFSLLLFITGCGNTSNSDAPKPQQREEEQAPNDVSSLNWKVSEFSFTDHHGKTFGTDDVKGKVWLADFVFTRCPNICPPMTANMVKLQEAIKKEGLDIPTLSFSVDPSHDTPEVLTEFAKEHGAEFPNWHFLTGYRQEKIQEMAKTCFKNIVEPQKQTSPDYPMLINHPSLFYLMDSSGKIVRYYDGLKPDITQIVKDIQNTK